MLQIVFHLSNGETFDTGPQLIEVNKLYETIQNTIQNYQANSIVFTVTYKIETGN